MDKIEYVYLTPEGWKNQDGEPFYYYDEKEVDAVDKKAVDMLESVIKEGLEELKQELSSLHQLTEEVRAFSTEIAEIFNKIDDKLNTIEQKLDACLEVFEGTGVEPLELDFGDGEDYAEQEDLEDFLNL